MSKRFALALAVALALLALTVWVMAPAVQAAGSPIIDPQQGEERPGQPVVIRWSTETEVNTAGFNVYRALSEEGPWDKLNERLIPGSPDPLRGGSYVYTDTQVIAGVTYWYELEEIELSGQATKLERTQATAKGQGLEIFGLPCGSGLGTVLAALAGLVRIRRQKRYAG